jgi:hypothetical protein
LSVPNSIICGLPFTKVGTPITFLFFITLFIFYII